MKHITTHLHLTAFLVTIASPALAQTQSAPLGINLYQHSSISSQIMFADAVKRATPWITANFPPDGQWNTGVSIPGDAQGYPLQLPYTPPSGGPAQTVASFLFNEMDGRYPSGTYTLIFEGSGLLVVSGANGEQGFTTGGSYPISVDPTQGNILLEIYASNANDHIRNIRFILPGHAQTYQTQPVYLAFSDLLDDFAVVRFMQTMQTNAGSYPCDNGVAATDAYCVKTWANRPQPDYFTQATERGVALEYLIDIANAAQVDGWFNVPHGADDNYVREMARLIRDRLHANLQVYVELSNEMWNFSGDYPQSEWARASGLLQGLDSDPDIARMKFVSKRSAEIFAIFDAEFGTQNARLVNVLPGFIANSWMNDQMLGYLDNPSLNPSGIQADAIAIAAYFGGMVLDEAVALGQSNISPTEIVNRARNNLTIDRPDPLTPGESILSLSSLLAGHQTIASNHQVALIAYEGGQHLLENHGVLNHQGLGQNAILANSHNDMYDAYNQMLALWEAAGGQLFMHYHLVARPSTLWGSFGSLEWIGQALADAPKYRALIDHINNP